VQQNPWTGGRQAPILPNAWSADIKVVDYTDMSVGYGKIWYDIRFGGLRIDFNFACPFIQAQDGQLNDVPCSVVFYKGNNYYVYPKSGICCGYDFPVWSPDCYRVSNASFGGVLNINGISVDYWRFTCTSQWIRPPVPETRGRLPADTLQRDIYVTSGGNIPVRMNETLTASYTDFTNLVVGNQDEQVFNSSIGNCLFEDKDPHFLRVCIEFFSRGRLSYLGYT